MSQTMKIKILKVEDTLQWNFSSQVRRIKSIQRETQLDVTWEVCAFETKIKWQKLSRRTLKNVCWSIIVSYATQKGISKLLTTLLSSPLLARFNDSHFSNYAQFPGNFVP